MSVAQGNVWLVKRWGAMLATAGLVIGASTAITPAASASEVWACEDTLPPTACEQVRETAVFVLETVGRVGPIVGETTTLVFQVTDSVYYSVKCTVQNNCPEGG